MFLPFRVKNPPESLPIATFVLLLLNVIIFFATQSGLQIRENVLDTYGISRTNFSAVTLVTSMFLHGDLFHLIGNMLFLSIFGIAVEGRLRTVKFLLLYFLAGFAGDLLQLAVMGSPKLESIPLIGASGAIMGVMGAALYMFPFAPVCFFFLSLYRLSTMEFVVEWPLWGAAAMYIAYDILGAMVGMGVGGGVANLAHLGGVAGGALICLIYRAKRDDEYVAEAKKTLAETKDYTLLWKRQLEDIINATPNDHKAALALVIRAYDENNMAKPEHLDHFKRNFRAMVADHSLDGQLSRAVVNIISKDPQTLSPGDYLLIAQAQMKARTPLPARTVLEGVRKMPNVPDSEMEAATYQLAQIYDQWLNQPESAYSLYYEIYQKWPMSPLIPSLTTRMQEMYPAVQAAAAQRTNLGRADS